MFYLVYSEEYGFEDVLFSSVNDATTFLVELREFRAYDGIDIRVMQIRADDLYENAELV